LERYIGHQIATSYLNDAELKSGQHFSSVVNTFFDVKELRATFRPQTSTDNDKKLARAYITDIYSFKDIISAASTYGDIEARMDELEGLGDNYIDAFIFSRHGWSKSERVLTARIRSCSLHQNPSIRYTSWPP